MKKLYEHFIERITIYFRLLMLAIGMITLIIGYNHYEKAKHDEIDILYFKAELYKTMSKNCLDSINQYPDAVYDTVWHNRAMKYQDIANQLTDSITIVLNK